MAKHIFATLRSQADKVILSIPVHVQASLGLGVKELKEAGVLLNARLALVLLELASLALGLLADLVADRCLGVGVETEENTTVTQRVLLLGEGTLGLLGTSLPDDALDLIRVDDTGNVGVGDLSHRKAEALLNLRSNVVSAEDLVELLECLLSPDHKAADVTTRGQLKQVEAVHAHKFNTWEVTERLNDAVVLVVDNERATALGVAAVTKLTDTSADLARVRRLHDIFVSTESLEDSNSLLGLGVRLNLAGDHKRHLLDLLDAVAAGKHERRERSGSKGRRGGEAALVLVGLTEPAAPNLRRSEHVTAASNVTNGSLTGAVGTTTTDTRNTRKGTTGTPRLSRGLVTSLSRDGVRLTLVLGNVGWLAENQFNVL